MEGDLLLMERGMTPTSGTSHNRAEFGLEACSLANPTSRLLMAVGPGYYRKASIYINLSHGGVCIFIMGVILSRDPWLAYVRS